MNQTEAEELNLSRILSTNAQLKAIARASLDGSVLEVAGEMDGETTCAVAAMAAQRVAEATSEAGLGPPSAWHVSLGDSTFYVVHRQEELLVMSGRMNRTPALMLRALAKSWGTW